MKRHGLALVGILALAVLLPLIPAGRRVLWESNEARYPLLAQDILDHGRWLVPELRGQLYLNKPQLYFWAIAGASLPAGRVSELSAALPSVLSALAAVAAVLAIGTRLWGRRAGLLAGLIAATAPPFFAFGHLTIPDMMLAAGLTWALYWFLRAESSGWARGPLAGFYVCVALAVGTKGPPGYAALAAAAITVLGTEGRRALARLRPALGLLILALAALPWIVPYYVQSHGQFRSDVLVRHYGVWLFRGSLLARVEGVAQTLVSFLPWSIFLVAAAWAWRRAPDEGRRRIALWTGALWALLVFTGIPRAHYLLPVYPLLALLTAEPLARARADGSPRPLRIAAAVASIYAVGVALALIVRPTLLAHGEDATLLPDAGWERGVVAVILVGGAIATGLLGRRRAWVAMTVAVALSLAGTLVLTGIRYPARLARDYDVRPLAAAAAGHVGPDGTVFGYPDLRLAYDFYLRRPVVELATVDRVLRLLASPEPGQVLITSRERWRDLSSRARSPWRVLATRTLDGHEIVVVGSPRP
jgi:4-amino-4-deoxy-L-arabinose transferase-like glycosyltransferase